MEIIILLFTNRCNYTTFYPINLKLQKNFYRVLVIIKPGVCRPVAGVRLVFYNHFHSTKVCVYVCVCVYAPEASGGIYMIGWIIAAAFQLHFVALVVDVIDRRGHSYEIRHQLQPKKTKVRLYMPFILQQKTFYPSFITNKTKRFSFKIGCVVWVANGEMVG